jgi:hypothetical protein
MAFTSYTLLREQADERWRVDHRPIWPLSVFVGPSYGALDKSPPGASGVWFCLTPSQRFARLHAVCAQSVAKYAAERGFVCGDHPWDELYRRRHELNLTVGHSAGGGYTIEASGPLIDENEALKEIVVAVMGLAICILAPELAIFAGFLATIVFGVLCLWISQVLAEYAAEVATGRFMGPEAQVGQLGAWASESSNG